MYGTIPADILIALQNASKATGVPEKYLISVCWTETQFQPKAVSPSNCKGLMQVTGATFNSMNTRYGLGYQRAPESWSPKSGKPNPNIGKVNSMQYATDIYAQAYAGALYLHELLEMFGGNERLAAISYNGGPAVGKYLQRHGINDENILYATRSIKAFKDPDAKAKEIREYYPKVQAAMASNFDTPIKLPKANTAVTTQEKTFIAKTTDAVTNIAKAAYNKITNGAPATIASNKKYGIHDYDEEKTFAVNLFDGPSEIIKDLASISEKQMRSSNLVARLSAGIERRKQAVDFKG